MLKRTLPHKCHQRAVISSRATSGCRKNEAWLLELLQLTPSPSASFAASPPRLHLWPHRAHSGSRPFRVSATLPFFLAFPRSVRVPSLVVLYAWCNIAALRWPGRSLACNISPSDLSFNTTTVPTVLLSLLEWV